MIRRGFHGLERTLRVLSGAHAVRVTHPPGQEIGEHRHDWPFLMLPAFGDFIERNEHAESRVAGPSAVLHAPGTCHANCIGCRGMETVSIEFDPDWLAAHGFDLALDRSRSWIGGRAAVQARKLAGVWRDRSAPEAELARATVDFLRVAHGEPACARPTWLDAVEAQIDLESPPSTAEIARRLDLHPGWLAHRYRAAVGEGLHETFRRKRVERAMLLLRNTDLSPAEIALDCGFCDQSHMNRAIRALADRTPLEVRAERALLEGLGGPH